MSFPVIGVVGGGQLARMMAPAAVALGCQITVLAESEDGCARTAIPTAPVGDYRDYAALSAFAQNVDVLTFDHEHVPYEHLVALQELGVNVQPGPEALRYAQDKLVMREGLGSRGLPVPEWAAVATPEELVEFGDRIGWPVILKTPRGGYDGKGVRVIADQQAAHDAADWFGKDFPHLLAEAMVPFSRELSAQVARTPSGTMKCYPVVESTQVDGICDEVIAPAPNIDPKVAEAAQKCAMDVAEALDVTGMLAVELFETPGVGEGFLINELAMRPHNSGHWSIDGSITSQFEQHLRAILDLPLGETTPLGAYVIMKNYLGGKNEDLYAAYPAAMAHAPAAKIHAYGKSVRPGRKIGHVNTIAHTEADLAAARAAAHEAAAIIRDGALEKD
ncbi:5-(carboxyamino)imidazole ribonucleotide synthase [Micrococcoides hystricis]|uniref:N5-carboxyaminoimidazole ribonucleotide synthase n=1 Tax=Micrococcoides hystricis TaxID=1572761 RepID=A0ABV6PA79_9MICC